MAGEQHKQILREKNRVAHQEVLKNDLADINAALATNSQENSRLIKANESLSKEGAALTEANLLASKELTQKTETTRTITQDAELTLAKIRAFEEESNNRLFTANLKAQTEVQGLKSQSAVLQDSITKLSKEIEALSFLKQGCEDGVHSLTLTLDGLRVKIREHEEDFKVNKSQSEQELKDLSKQIIKAQEELARVSELVLQEKKKVEMPAKAFEAEKREFERKKADLDIYAMRVHSYWRKVFPDKAMVL